LLAHCGLANPPKLDEIFDIQLEMQLPEIKSYRKFLKNHAYHYFPDVLKNLESKKVDEKASMEGPTHVDLFIHGRSGEKNICFVIEAKYNSDISKDIKYCPVRDQVIRNIDAALDYKEHELTKDQKIPIDEFYFLLLTPGVFRTDRYLGNNSTLLDSFRPQLGRFYCYKMNDYKDPTNLKMGLPHRTELSDSDWARIAGNIGWITFEEMFQTALHNGTMYDEEQPLIEDFFQSRNLV
jgi:hypothetical protein